MQKLPLTPPFTYMIKWTEDHISYDYEIRLIRVIFHVLKCKRPECPPRINIPLIRIGISILIPKVTVHICIYILYVYIYHIYVYIHTEQNHSCGNTSKLVLVGLENWHRILARNDCSAILPKYPGINANMRGPTTPVQTGHLNTQLPSAPSLCKFPLKRRPSNMVKVT